MRRDEIQNISDIRNNLSNWSESYCFSRSADFSAGKAQLNFDEATRDPAFAGTNSGIYEISIGSDHKYKSGKSTIVNIGLTNMIIKTRISRKFSNQIEKIKWNELASKHDLYVRFRSNQVIQRGTDVKLEVAEALYLHAFEQRFGEMPLMNKQKRQLIKASGTRGHPEPKDRARVLFNHWLNENQPFADKKVKEITVDDLDGVEPEFIQFIDRHIGSENVFCGIQTSRGFSLGFTRLFFSKDSLCVAQFTNSGKALMSDSKLRHIKYEMIDFELQEESNAVHFSCWNNTLNFNHKIPGFGKLCKKLGLLAAIAELR